MKKNLKYIILSLLILLCILLISVFKTGDSSNQKTSKETPSMTIIVSKEKQGSSQTGYVIETKKEDTGGSILVASSLKNSDLQKKYSDLYKLAFNKQKSNLTYYNIQTTSAFNQLKYGQKVTIYNNGKVAFSYPAKTAATKIIIYK